MEKTRKPMKRHLLLLAAALTMGAAATAQSAYDQTHHYDLVSKCDIGITAQYTRKLPQGPGNVGALLHLYKQIGTHSRFRAIGGIDGFLNNGFDRKGFAMVGLSADFLPFYVFLDGGISINPSSPQTVNPAAEVGIGLHFDIGRNLRMFTEIGADLTSNGLNKYATNGFVRFGYAYHTGITERDRKEIDETQRNKQMVGELTGENRTLRSEVARQEEANRQLQSTLDRATAAIEASQLMLKECKESAPATAANDGLTVYFRAGSSEINATDAARLASFAASIADGSAYYRIDGYSSAEGNPVANDRLSQERADAVYSFLLDNGVPPYRLAAIGMGVGNTYDGQAALNRIATIIKVTQ